MTCIKTGFHGYIEPYDEYVIGDAFALDCELKELGKTISLQRSASQLERALQHANIGTDPVYCFRIVMRSKEPIRNLLHFTVHGYDQWWDKGGPDTWGQRINSTMFTSKVTNHGYEGKVI